MKINFQQLWRSVPKRTAAAGLVLALAIAPVMLGAWGGKRPTYTIQHPADHVTFNSITDNPNHGDERNFFSVRDTDSKEWDKANKNGWTDTMELKAGHTYEAQIYVHNNAAANLNLVAKNVRVHTNLPVKESTYGHQFEVNAFLWSDNAKPNEIWDNIVLKSDREFHVKVVAQKYFNNARPENSTKGFDLGPELTGSTGRGTGALLGFNQMDGNIPGCFHYDGYVSIKFQPVFRVVPAPKFDLEKQVNRTSIKAGETLDYTLTFRNTGNANLHNVTVTDKLPASVKLVAGSLKADAKFTGDLEQGMKFAEVKAGQNVTVNFSVTTDEAKLQCGKNEVVNTARAASDEVKHEFQRFLGNNTTKTTVEKTCAPTPTPTPTPEPKPEPKQGFDLEKRVNKTVAQAGDSLTYTLTFHNTGETTLHNVVLTDKLPAGTKLVKDSLKSAAQFTGDLEQGIKLAEVKAGESVSLNFAVTTEASALQCGKNDVVNAAIATTDEVKHESLNLLGNNVVKTVVNRVCAPAPNPVVPTPVKPTPKPVKKPAPAPVKKPAPAPREIAKTGATDALSATAMLTILGAMVTAYIRSRH